MRGGWSSGGGSVVVRSAEAAASVGVGGNSGFVLHERDKLLVRTGRLDQWQGLRMGACRIRKTHRSLHLSWGRPSSVLDVLATRKRLPCVV